jgi:sugar (pentulose or hexulose) kinase
VESETAEISPNAQNAGVYESRYEAFLALYERTKDLMAKSQ